MRVDHLGVLAGDVGHQHVLARERPAELGDVHRRPCRRTSPAPWRRTERCPRRTGYARPAADRPVPRRERVRSAAGAAGHGEALETEMVRERDDVGDTVDDSATGEPGRTAVARPVVGDEPRPGLERTARGSRVPVEPAARCPVQAHHREAVGVAPLRVAESATFGQIEALSAEAARSRHARDPGTGRCRRPGSCVVIRMVAMRDGPDRGLTRRGGGPECWARADHEDRRIPGRAA